VAVINGDDNPNILNGTSADDVINGFGGNDSLSGLEGDDVLRGGAGADSLLGGDGVDTATYFFGTSGVTVNLVAGTGTGDEAQGDTLIGIENVTGSNVGGDSLIGDGKDNVLNGWAGDDVLGGGAGNDTLEGGTGTDTLDGGDGADTASYYADASGASVDLAIGVGSGSDDLPDSLVSIENAIGSRVGGDVLTGSSGANVLRGEGGNDLLRGGAGADSLDGGAGVDTVTYSDSASGVTVDLAAGTGAGGDAQGDILTGIDDAIGSSFNDILTSSGASTLWGGGGNDVLRGGAGIDKLFGGAGADTASYYASASGVMISIGTGTGGDALGDQLNSIENLTGSNVGGDILTGGGGAANVLSGWGGDDQLVGAGGADRLDGGVGTDAASYFDSDAAVTVNLAAGTASGGSAQGDILISIENLNGSSLNDTLTGNGAVNALRGWVGRDMLTGGGGADSFVYAAISESAVGANADRITDFSHAQGDRIDLSLLDANGTAPGNGIFSFIGSGLYTGVAGQLRCAVTSPGVTTVAGDVNGDKVSDFHITLTGNLTLVASDFVL
jgi:Ca2+-binding RTX toxin-like protein